MRTLIAAFALLLVAGCGQGQPQRMGGAPDGGTASTQSDPLLREGEILFQVNCLACHGKGGMGDGPAAHFLFPKPRNFTLAKYKIRSTAMGEAPTDGDLLRTLERGIPGTAMPSYGYLPLKQREALVAYIKSLAVIDDGGKKVNLFDRFGKPREIKIEKEWPSTPELVKKGAAVYKAQGCNKCHGDSGVGDGPSSDTLVDEAGYPIPPANFTRGLYKGGGTPSDIYMRFTTGMTGTPMPSFEKTLTEEERWALVHYVKSLERPGRPEIPQQKSEIAIRGAKVARLPVEPFDKTWEKAAAVALPLMHIWQRQEAADILTVRVLHDGESIAVMLEWEDAKVDGLQLRPQDFTDACAVMFAMSDPPGHFTMGEKDRPCNIWFWRMDRQLDMAKFFDVEDQYPGMVADDYPLSHGPKTHRPIDPAQSHDPTFLTGKGAGNPASQTERRTPVQDLNSVGFGTLTPQPEDQQSVMGRGVWANGRWRVVFNRKLVTGEAKDAVLSVGKTNRISCAVWDGGSGDRNGQKSVTFWQRLELE
jgi:mono/diheme cytochrome c family protein